MSNFIEINLKNIKSNTQIKTQSRHLKITSEPGLGIKKSINYILF